MTEFRIENLEMGEPLAIPWKRERGESPVRV